jgi:hypothetical protein
MPGYMRAPEVVYADETGWLTELSTTAPQMAISTAAAQAARKARMMSLHTIVPSYGFGIIMDRQ